MPEISPNNLRMHDSDGLGIFLFLCSLNSLIDDQHTPEKEEKNHIIYSKIMQLKKNNLIQILFVENIFQR